MAENSPNNSDILKEVKSINRRLDSFDARLKPLESWKIAFDAADAAVTKYKQEHQSATQSSPQALSAISKDFLKIIAQLIGVLATILGIIYLVLSKTVFKG